MDGKTMIDQAFVKEIQKSHTRTYRFIMGVLIVTAVGATLVGGSAGFLAGLIICGSIGFGMTWYRRKAGGELQVYFIQRPMTNKRISYRSYDDEPGSYEVYFLDFGDKSYEVNDKQYRDAYVSEPYYVMYNAYNNRIMNVYEVAKYNLDPSLDIRQCP